MSGPEIDRRYDIEIIERINLKFFRTYEEWALDICAALSSEEPLIPYYVDLRSGNVRALAERIHRAQKDKTVSQLYYRDEEYNTFSKRALILAAMPGDSNSDPRIRLWIALSPQEKDYTNP